MQSANTQAASRASTAHRFGLPAQAWWCLAVLATLDACALIQKLRSLHGRHLRSVSDLSQTMHRGYDLLGFADRFRSFGTPAFFDLAGRGQFNYPAPMAVVLALLFHLSPGGVIRAFNLILGVFLCVAAGLFVVSCRRRGLRLAPACVFTAAMLLLAFPVQLLWFMGNTELFVWVLVSAGLWAWFTGKPWLAALCLGLAGSLKYFPLAFLGMFPIKRQWHHILAGLLVCAASIVASLAIMGPGIAFAAAGLRRSAGVVSRDYVQSFRPLDSGYDHSIFAFIKVILVRTGHLGLLPHLLTPYLLLAATVALALYFLRIQHLPAPSRLLALTIIAITIMPISQEYTLVHLFAPMAVLLLQASNTASNIASNTHRTTRWLFPCFGFLLTALDFGGPGISLQYGGQAKCLVLLTMMVLSLQRGPASGLSINRDRI